ncbi:MAG: hypothetical protein ACRDFY_05810 [Candidatus Limnocylindria bacterium]
MLITGIVPVAAQQTGTDQGEVIFRVTLRGPVDADDAFVIWSVCPDEFCQTQVVAGGPIEAPVIACGPPVEIADAVVCSERTYEWTVDLSPGTLEYRFERQRDVPGDDERQLLHTGTWEVHSGRQVLTFVYEYPGGAATLPNTAVPAP